MTSTRIFAGLWLAIGCGVLARAAVAMASDGTVADVASPITFDPVNLSALGLMGWYVVYVTSKTIPQLVDEFKQEMRGARDDQKSERELHREEMAAIRTAFHAEIMAINESHHEDMQMIAAALRHKGGS